MVGLVAALGNGAIGEIWVSRVAAIPAKAGIYSANLQKCAVPGVDSRFRGNDLRLQMQHEAQRHGMDALPTADQ